MADWPDWTVPYNGEFYFLYRAKNDKFCLSSVQYDDPQPQLMPKMDHKWSSTVNDPQIGPQMIPK